MLSHCFRSALIGFVVLAVSYAALVTVAAAERRVTNGIYILDAPVDYDAFQLLIRKYKDSGADSIIIRPVSKTGAIDTLVVAKSVFFAHDIGLKLFVVLPTRAMKRQVEEHPDWEDKQYDPATRSIKRSGKLDLFNPSVSAYLLEVFKDIAGYSIDGIILDDDFYYSDTEGQTASALKQYKLKFGSRFSYRKALGNVREEERTSTDLYGNGFWNLAELKKNVLLSVFENIVRETRSVNKDLKFGISLHVPGLFLKKEEMLAWYSHDLEEFSRVNADFFWLEIPHRDIRREHELSYRKGMEAVSRKATATGMLLKEGNVLIAVQTATQSGRTLPLSEIEEVSLQAKKAGNPGIAFMVLSDTDLPPVLTQKIFKGPE